MHSRHKFQTKTCKSINGYRGFPCLENRTTALVILYLRNNTIIIRGDAGFGNRLSRPDRAGEAA